MMEPNEMTEWSDDSNGERPNSSQDHGHEPRERRVVDVAGSEVWVYKGSWGLGQKIAALSAGVFVIASLGFFLVFVNPAKGQVALAQSRLDTEEQKLKEIRGRLQRGLLSEAQTAAAFESATKFEIENLPNESEGVTALYRRINELVTSNGLRITSGMTSDRLETKALGEPESEETGDDGGRGNLRSVFPGRYMTVTVDGGYSRVMNFVSQLETSKQFLILNSVSMEPSDRTPSSSNPSLPNGMQSGGRRDNVSVKVELTAYFKRPSI